MKKDVKKTDPEWFIFQDIWQFYLEFGTPEDKQTYWKSAIDKANAIAEKYKGNHIAERLGLAVLKALNDELNDKKGEKK